MLTTVKMKEDLIRDCKHTTYEDCLRVFAADEVDTQHFDVRAHSSRTRSHCEMALLTVA